MMPPELKQNLDLIQMLNVNPASPVNPGSSVSVGATSTRVMTLNPKRLSATIVNNSANDVSLRKAETGAVAGEGIVLKASGGSWTFGLATDDPYTGPVCGIASGASVISLTEM